VVRIDPVDHAISGVIPLPIFDSNPIAAGLGAVWAVAQNNLVKISPSTNSVVGVVGGIPGNSGNQRGSLATGGGVVWFATSTVSGGVTGSFTGGKVLQISPKTNSAVASIPTSAPVGDIAFGSGSVWTVVGSQVTRIDPKSGEISNTFPFDSTYLSIAYGEGLIWVLESLNGTLSPIDPATNTVERQIPLAGSPVALAVGLGAVWLVDATTATVLKVPPDEKGGIATVRIDTGPVENRLSSIAVGAGGVWVGDGCAGTVSLIDPAGLSVTDTIDVGGGCVGGIAVAEQGVWVVAGGRPDRAE
jgi:YVTN family beta-propeller protein